MVRKLKPCKPHQARSRTTNRCRNKSKPKTTRKCKIRASSKKRRSRSRSRSYVYQEPIPIETSPVFVQKVKKVPSRNAKKTALPEEETLSSVLFQEFERIRNARYVPDLYENELRRIDRDMIDILYGVYRAAFENNKDLQGRLNFLDKQNCSDTKTPSHDMTCGLSLVGDVDPTFQTVDPTSNLYQQVILWRTHAVDSGNSFQRSDLKWAIAQSLTTHDELDMCFLGEKGFTRLFLGKIVGAPKDFESLPMDNMEREVDRLSINDLGAVNNYLKDYGFVKYTEYNATESKARHIEPIHWSYAVFITGAISTYYLNVFQSGYVQNFIDKVVEAINTMPGFFKEISQDSGPSTPEQDIFIDPEFFPGHQGSTDTGYTGPQLLIDQLNEVPNLPFGTALVPFEIFSPFDPIQKDLEAGKIYKFRKAINDSNYEHFRDIIEQFTFLEGFLADEQGPAGGPGPMEGPAGGPGPIEGPVGGPGTMEGPAGGPGPIEGPAGGPGPMEGPEDGPVEGPAGGPGPMEGPAGGPGPMEGPNHELNMEYLRYIIKISQIQFDIFTEAVNHSKAGDYWQKVKEVANRIRGNMPVHGPITKPWDEGDEIPNGVSYEGIAFVQEAVNVIMDGLADKEHVLQKMKEFNRRGRQNSFLVGRITWADNNLEDVGIIIKELVFNAGKQDEKHILSEKGLEYLRDLTNEQVKDFNKRLVEYEKVVGKEIDDYKKLVKTQEEKGGQKPFLPYVKPVYVPDKLPEIGVLHYPDMINFGDLTSIPIDIFTPAMQAIY